MFRQQGKAGSKTIDMLAYAVILVLFLLFAYTYNSDITYSLARGSHLKHVLPFDCAQDERQHGT